MNKEQLAQVNEAIANLPKSYPGWTVSVQSIQLHGESAVVLFTTLPVDPVYVKMGPRARVGILPLGSKAGMNVYLA